MSHLTNKANKMRDVAEKWGYIDLETGTVAIKPFLKIINQYFMAEKNPTFGNLYFFYTY